MLIENARPAKGRFIVIPRANASGFTHNDYSEGSPQHFSLPTPAGERWFRFGSRATNPIHQWPDPDIYVHPSGQRLSGSETRNLNRAYPGRPDGNLTEHVAYGIVQLIRTEKADIAIDLHEASPEYPVINAMVAHDRAMEVAATAVIGLQLDGIEIGLEPSPKTLRGLSIASGGMPPTRWRFLLNRPIPLKDACAGPPAPSWWSAARTRCMRAPQSWEDFSCLSRQGIPLSVRVARHSATIKELVRTFSEITPDRTIELKGVPSYDDMVKQGVGSYL